jgi:hypothetical protein
MAWRLEPIYCLPGEEDSDAHAGGGAGVARSTRKWGPGVACTVALSPSRFDSRSMRRCKSIYAVRRPRRLSVVVTGGRAK